MEFIKKIAMGFGAFFLILVGGAGTQSSSTFLQGGGFVGLLIGLVILYIFAKMAWRAMGCLPSFLIILGIICFVLYAIGAFRDGLGGVPTNVKRFLGQGGEAQYTQPQTPESEERETPSYADNVMNHLSESFGKKPRQEERAPQYPMFRSSVGVINGDTLRVNNVYFKLYGVAAPDLSQRCADSNGRSYSCGKIAARWLRDWIMDNPVECRVMQQDQKGNMVGTCSLGQYDLGAAIVNAGWAVAYVKYTDIYVPYEYEAKRNSRGLWSGSFYKPWEWRKIQNQRPEIQITRPRRKKINDIFE